MDPDGDNPTMELPPPGQSARLLQAMNLTSRQRGAAVAFRNHLLSRMGGSLRRRRDISLELLRSLGHREEHQEVRFETYPWEPSFSRALR
jgi:hypothetical protein